MKILLILVTSIILIYFASAEVRINEVMYSPNCAGDDCEYFEIYSTEQMNITILDKYGSNNKSLNTSLEIGYNVFTSDKSAFILYWIDYNNTKNLSISLANEDALWIYDINLSLRDYFSYNTSMGAYNNNKSLQYCDNTWKESSPTPGLVNNCTIIQVTPICAPIWSCTSWSSCSDGSQTRTCSDNNNCNNNAGKPPLSQSCNSKKDISLEMDWNEEEIINGEEFSINLKANNLNHDKYAVMVWIENDDGDIISERYGNYSDKGDVWVSGKYYVYNFFQGSGDESDKLNLRIQKKYSNFSGEATIFFKMKDGEEYKIDENIEILEQESDSEYSNGAEVLTTTQNSEMILASSNVITLNPKSKLNTKRENSIIYKSKTEYIREYAPYAFSLICIFIMILILFDKKK